MIRFLKLLAAQCLLEGPTHCPALMGNYLSRFLGWPWAQKPRPTRKHCSQRPRPLIRSQAQEQCKVIYFHGNRWVRTRPLPTAPPGRDYARVRRVMVPEAWRRFPNRPQLLSNV
ncbi:putative inactive carbonic anhydrase 5B-like protein isoform X2 [Aotus nancymaae]|uniref:putative inactive carbonic anhydrase 5B-like protein isoform X2 n=1 Tax=Aotus nancymaae TaxID=37293 RepID=UPI0030FE44E2